ncbi:uncharacterized protein BKCO1_630007 [Diplodia corticola]|uniref:Secreted protein n=1 Tax=Diplodia corticola TaxID=236234 RepID=A0A1J9QQF3_9PEZI|nr:uncharacterized protein BKCO1_630007 [Diplodia corticola]OJD30258.1 secreted protein [Diplodia corticola]
MHKARIFAAAGLITNTASASFADPETEHRPKFRYWYDKDPVPLRRSGLPTEIGKPSSVLSESPELTLHRLPDASVPVSIVQEDIATIAAAGVGGIEFVPYYQYGLPESESGVVPPTDWTKYGFGSDAFRNIFKAALEACRANNITMDFAQGANQGAGAPSPPEDVGLAVEMAYANVTVGAGQTFNGTLPLSKQLDNPFTALMNSPQDFGQQTLFAVQAIEVVSTSRANVGEGEFSSSYALNQVGEVIDLTAQIGAGRSLNWTAPAGNSTWRVIAWYERYTNQKSCQGGLNATDPIGNGSWAVDHFSANGSKKITQFLDEHVFPDAETRELLASVGRLAWEDSMEMVSSLWWTPSLPSRFSGARGYAITSCLPFLIVPDNSWNSAIVPYGEGFQSAENKTFGQKCSEDYRTTLSEGYNDYLTELVNWSNERGLSYSAQPAYNLPLEMLNNIPVLNIPEGESLAFSDVVDTYRQFSGPAHLAGMSVISSECGAVSGGPYSQSLPDLLWSVRRGLSAGISMHVLHGFAYSGRYTNTTWPSFTTFFYMYSDMWNSNQPSWIHINDSIQYIARNQYMLQGHPSVDLAFHMDSAPWKPEEYYTDTNLESLGYTYEYLSSGNLENATVRNGILAPSGPSYKALIFLNPTEMTPDAAMKTRCFADAGLPIFIVGGTNFSDIGQEPGAAAQVSNISSDLHSHENVHVLTSSAKLPEALSGVGILPKTSFSSNTTTWYSAWRSSGGIEYVYIYNDASFTQSINVAFATDPARIPYHLNAWTGATTAVLQYNRTTTGITIPVTLAANQTTIFGFAPANTSSSSSALLPSAPPVHVTSSGDALVALVDSTESGSTMQKLSAYLSGGTASLQLSTGATVNLTASPPPPTNLTTWDIRIESWHRDEDDDDRYSMATAVTNHVYNDSRLAPWTELGGDDGALDGVSGVGRYRTTFVHPSVVADGEGSGNGNGSTAAAALSGEKAKKVGAILHLGPVVNTIRVWLNGAVLPPIDIADAVVDVSDYVLEERVNEVVVEVTTTLFNRVKADADATWTYGLMANNEKNGRFYEVNEPKGYGLLGPVWVQWVEVVDVL